MDKEIFKKLYMSYIRPKLEFASHVWSPHIQKQKELIERVQMRTTKMVLKLRNPSYRERFNEKS